MASVKVSPRLVEVANQSARLAWAFSSELGLTPAGHARLRELVSSATVAEASLVRLAEQGAEIRRARAVDVRQSESGEPGRADVSELAEGEGLPGAEPRLPAAILSKNEDPREIVPGGQGEPHEHEAHQ